MLPLTLILMPFVPTRLDVWGTLNSTDCAPLEMVIAPACTLITTVPLVNVVLLAAMLIPPPPPGAATLIAKPLLFMVMLALVALVPVPANCVEL